MIFSPFHLCCGCEGKAKSQAPSVVLQAMEPFCGSMIIISCPIMPVKSFEQLFNMFGSGAGGAAIRFYCGAWHSFTSAVTFLLGRFMFDHACCLPHVRQTGRLAVGCVSIPRGSGSPLERSQRPCGYRTLQVHFGIVRFLWRSRRSTTGVSYTKRNAVLC